MGPIAQGHNKQANDPFGRWASNPPMGERKAKGEASGACGCSPGPSGPAACLDRPMGATFP